MTDKSMVILNNCVSFRLKKYDQGSGNILKILSIAIFFNYSGFPN